MPNPLAFQQNYSCYDGPSESGIFPSLDEPVLTSYLPDVFYASGIPNRFPDDFIGNYDISIKPYWDCEYDFFLH